MLLEVNRSDYRQTRTIETPRPDLAAGQVRLGIERFALTTNNVTYAVAGDMLDYWGFFPADEGWGRIPVMSLSTVAESAHPDIEVGGRYFGWTPMADEVVIDARPSERGIRDVGANRSNHAPVYVAFESVDGDALFDPTHPDEYLLFRGLFMTSYLVDDALADDGFHGASQTLVTSASSKTSISLAACLRHRDDHRSVGLTSSRNRAFVESLGLYDQVLEYGQIADLDPDVVSGLVDMAGNAGVRGDVHRHFGDELAYSMTVGVTHWEAEPDDAGSLPGPRPEMFFAPGQAAKRTSELGAEELQSRIAASFRALVDQSGEWLVVDHRRGADDVEGAYRELLEGTADPATGYICFMGEEAVS